MPAPVPGTPAWYRSRATPIPPDKTKQQPPKKLKTTVVPLSTPQNYMSGIETPAQIEARVGKLAKAAYDRQYGAVQAEAAKLRQEAEGRRRGMQAAYQAAAQANVGMAQNVQSGWNTAAQTIQGMANEGTGAVAEALARDVATQEQALGRVGAGGTGFDARSQAGVEAYRGGTLPSQMFARLGGVGNQWLNESAISIANRGLQEGRAEAGATNAKIDTDILSQVKDLTESRTKYEADLREQLLKGRGDQVAAAQKQEQADAKLRFDYYKQKNYLDMKDAELKASYREALLRATTAADKLKVDRWYKDNKLNIDTGKANAYIAAQGALTRQRNVAAETKKAGSWKTNGPIPDKFPLAFDQFGARLDQILNGRDPRLFKKTLLGEWTLKDQYKTAHGAKLLQDDLMRIVGTPYMTKFGAPRYTPLLARAYAKAFAAFKLYTGAQAPKDETDTSTPGQLPNTTSSTFPSL